MGGEGGGMSASQVLLNNFDSKSPRSNLTPGIFSLLQIIRSLNSLYQSKQCDDSLQIMKLNRCEGNPFALPF